MSSKRTKRQTSKTGSVQTPASYVSSAGSRFDREFNPDYSPVIKDLRRIGILAGSFFMVLVVLSFFLR